VFDEAWWIGVSAAVAGEVIFAAALRLTRNWWLPAWRAMGRTLKVVTVVVVVTVVLAIATPAAGWWPSIARGAQSAWCAVLRPVTIPLVVLIIIAIPALIIAPLLVSRLRDRRRRRREFQPDAIQDRILRLLGEFDGQPANPGEIVERLHIGALYVNQALEGMKVADIIWWSRGPWGQRIGLTSAGRDLAIAKGYAPKHPRP
jgi:hypothetical protein